MPDEELAAFQAAMLEVLASAPDGEAALRALRERPEAASFLGWLDGCDPRMVTVAGSLLRRWGAPEGMAPPAGSG